MSWRRKQSELNCYQWIMIRTLISVKLTLTGDIYRLAIEELGLDLSKSNDKRLYLALI